MANEIRELLNEVRDERVRARLAGAIDELRKTKKFGIVFEEHLPELIPLYKSKVRKQLRVARKRQSMVDTFIVQKVTKNDALVTPEHDPNSEERIPLEGLRMRSRYAVVQPARS